MTQPAVDSAGEAKRGRRAIGGALALSILAYVALFTSIAYSRFRSFESYRPQDMAAHSQAIWNTAHGRFLQETVHYVGGLNHFYPILALFAPIYRATDSMGVLLFLYSLVMGSGGLAVYLIARDRLGSRGWGLAMALSYLAFPGLHYANLMDLKPIMLAIPFILFTFYFWQAHRFRAFLVSCLLTALVTEQVAPLIAMFGPLSWVKKRGARWFLPPPLIGGAVLLFSMYVYVPLVSGASYEHLRVHGLFSHLDPFSWRAYEHVFSFVGLTIGFLALSWESFLLAVPYLFFGTIAKALYIHYYFPLVAILFLSWIYGVERISRWVRARGVTAFSRRAALACALAIPCFYAFDPFLARPGYHYPMTPSARHAWALIRQVPPSASVTCDTLLLPALSRRERLHGFSRKEYHGEKIEYLAVDYVLIDPRGPHFESARNRKFEETARSLMARTQAGRSGFKIVATMGDWVLLRGKPRPWQTAR